MKEYPYTIIYAKQFLLFYNSLVKFGYSPSFNIQRYIKHEEIQSVYVVINDTDKFGHFCFYSDYTLLDRNIKRVFIKDPYRFLKCAAKYKNFNEL